MSERSAEEVRRALDMVCPEIAGLPIELHDMWIEQENPLWDRSSAFVGDEWVVKFAWSEPAAKKLEREIAVLRTLAATTPSLPVRRIAAWSSDPVLFVSPFVAGSPILGSDLAKLDHDVLAHLAQELADVLAQIHATTAHDAITAAGVSLPVPTPQADTDALRNHFVPMLDTRRQQLVTRWCDWVDNIEARDDTTVVLLHGDFHGYNLIVDDTFTIRTVLDLEEASVGDCHYDFRYLPAQAATLDLFLATVHAYERLSKRTVATDRVMAWHIRTVLGDALWRTEARVTLPGGGTPRVWIDELEQRMVELELDAR